MTKKLKVGISIIFFLTVFSAVYFTFYVNSLKNLKEPAPLSENQKLELNALLDSRFKERTKLVHQLPYPVIPANLSISAENAILIDTLTGSILFEKAADTKVPPASMTKLVVMYIVFKEIEAGHLSLDQIIPLPPECWARNMPPDSSLMFLDQGQKVTLFDLLSGLAIVSGNDAAVAIALHISGSVEKFVERMNREIAELGLTDTHFVEPSGYSEKNITTPREFAAFARVYLEKFPQSLELFHSKKSFVFPRPENLPPWQQANPERFAITAYNTNKLLWHLEGCDGLKTGFIYESGYNLSLTAKRKGTRFLSVTMHGAGIGTAQGNKHKIEDGTTLMEWAFANFADYKNQQEYSFTVAVPGGKEKSVNLIPVFEPYFLTVPFIAGSSPQEAADRIKVSVQLPDFIMENANAAEVYGKLVYSLDGTVLQIIPLAADRTVEKAGFPGSVAGKLAMLFL